jgi:class 3 adenylate cyclase
MHAPKQRRHLATLMFTDLSDSTALAAGLEPEQFVEVIEKIRAIAQRVIPANGGQILRIDGDGLLCLFGFPDPHEDAGRRATEAALDMHAGMGAIAAMFDTQDLTLRLHSGIHAGMVVVREGDLVRGKYEVLGDATNVTARLCDAAAPGQILVSAQTLGSERHFFSVSELRQVTLRGHRTPLACLSVTGRTGITRRYEARQKAGLTPFQGRGAELARFADWLARPADHPAVLGIHGPAGIGKSRFLSRIAEDATELGWGVAFGYCEAYLNGQPLQAFKQAAASRHKGADGAQIEATDDLLAAFQGQRVFLMIDDWQWADDASHDFLAALLSRADPAQLRCVLASREADFDLPYAGTLSSLALAAMGRDEILSAIEQLLVAPDPFVVDRIMRASGGSPLLVEELCHAFANGAAALTQDPRDAWFDQSVQARFDRLDQTDREVLKLSAVIGHIIPVWLIESLLGAPLNAVQLERLGSVDFLFEGEAEGTYRFKHGLTRDALYAGLGREERRLLHGEVLAALEDMIAVRGRESLIDPLAYHAVAAGETTAALGYAIAAGDGALKAGALDRAQGHYLAALELTEGLPSASMRQEAAWALLNKYGLACIVDPAPDQLAVLERIQVQLREGGEPRRLQRTDYWLGSIAYGVGLGKASVRHLEAALERAEAEGAAGDSLLIRTKLAQSLFASGRVADAAARFGQVLPDLAQARTRNQRELGAYAHAAFGFLTARTGDHAAADALFDKADQILDNPASAMNASMLLYRSASMVYRGAWEEAIVAVGSVEAVSHRSRARMQNRTCRAQAAYARWQLHGRPVDAAALEAVAREYLGEDTSRQHVSMVFGWVVEVMAETGNIALARAYMRQIIARARIAGDRLGEAMGWRAMAQVAEDSGDPARADRYLAFARRSELSRLSASEAAHSDLCAASLLAARGRSDEAAALNARAAQAFARLGMPAFAAAAAGASPLTTR